MASSASPMTFAPHQPSPLARTTSPFKDPRPAPCTPAKTAKLWDLYERRAVENAKQRDMSKTSKRPQRSSAGDVRKSVESTRSTTGTRSSFDFKFKRSHTATPSTTVAICKSCKQPITYASGICERCKRTIILQTANGETTPPLSPSSRNLAVADLQQLHASLSEIAKPTATSPKRRSFCPLPAQLVEPPIRLSSLQPPPPPTTSSDSARSRKASLTDPNEPFLRLQITHQHASYPPTTRSASHPSTPTATMTPLTPPSTSHSRSSTRPSSLATTAPFLAPFLRNNSTTPSDFSTHTSPYTTTTSTSTSTGPPSLCRSSYALHNTTSAWDDWDSADEEEKTSLVGWMGGRKKARKGVSSLDSLERRGSPRTESRAARKSRDADEELGGGKGSRGSAEGTQTQRRPRGFVRAISCGCTQE
ncbi:hypothetical protein ACN47E_000372 [Coniothyrium glycines]